MYGFSMNFGRRGLDISVILYDSIRQRCEFVSRILKRAIKCQCMKIFQTKEIILSLLHYCFSAMSCLLKML